MLQEQVYKQLDKIFGKGKPNSIQAALKEFFIADRMRSYASKRYRSALNQAKSWAEAEEMISAQSELAIKQRLKSSLVLHHDDEFVFSVNFSAPAMRLNEDLIVLNLVKDHGWELEIARGLIEKSKEASAPAKNFVIAETGAPM